MEFLDPRPSTRFAGHYDRGYLPHLRAQGRSYFVTFRLEGTLPQEVLRQYQAEREALLAKARAAQSEGELSPEDQQRLFDLYSEKIEAYLDAGRGECWLKEARIGEVVAGALRFFHGQRYDLGPWVVMPSRACHRSTVGTTVARSDREKLEGIHRAGREQAAEKNWRQLLGAGVLRPPRAR